MKEFYNQVFNKQNESYSVIVEDDGKVAYAYLLNGRNIIGDVWLYNQADTPTVTDWTDKENMPFLNPKEFVEKNVTPITDSSEIKVEWSDDLQVSGVLLYIRNKLIAKLTPNSKPGWSANVIKDGPLAKRYSR